MINLLQNVMHTSNPDDLHHLVENLFDNPSIHIYWKDNEGKYIGCNDSMAKQAGLNTGREVVGMTDYDDLSWSCFASVVCDNDKEVVSNNKAKSIVEPFRTSSGDYYNFYSVKSPWVTKSNKIAGVLGISIKLNKSLAPGFVLQLKDNNSKKFDISILTKRQQQCLYYLVRGMTFKEIAKIMHLSAKTVEHYLNTVKYKLGCQSRSELIMKATENLILAE